MESSSDPNSKMKEPISTVNKNWKTPNQKAVKRKLSTPSSNVEEKRRATNDVSFAKPPPEIDYAKLPPRFHGELTNQMSFCQKLLKDLSSSPSCITFNWPFLEPVDAVALQIPDYYRIIKNPMDLSTMQKKMDAKQYVTAEEFYNDFMLICANCFVYNPEGNPVNLVGKQMKEYFLQRWKELPSEEVVPKKSVVVKKQDLRPATLTSSVSVQSPAVSTSAPQMTFCQDLLRELSTSPSCKTFNWPFLEPVDASVPNYYRIIKNPMDLSTMQKKLDAKQYTNADEFRADFMLICDNCFTFNPVGNPVNVAGKKLKDYFLKRWKDLPSEKPVPKKSVVVKKQDLRPSVAKSPVVTSVSVVKSSVASTSIPQSSGDLNENTTKQPLEIDYAKLAPRFHGKLNKQMTFCQNLLKDLSSPSCNTFNFPFLEPVDAVALQIPDYYDVIKNPMDLLTMQKKMDAKQYANADEFRADFMLICDNCFLYNPEGNPVNVAGKQMKEYFLQRWKELPSDEVVSKKPVVTKKKKSRSPTSSSSVSVQPSVASTSVPQSAEKPIANAKQPPEIDYAKLAPRFHGKLTKQMIFCQKLIRELSMNPSCSSFNWPFLEPVDAVKLNIPEYYDAIKNPMDLSTMRKKMAARQYATAEEVYDDFMLICDNCFSFNPEGDPVNVAGKQMKEYFLQRWKELPSEKVVLPVPEKPVVAKKDSSSSATSKKPTTAKKQESLSSSATKKSLVVETDSPASSTIKKPLVVKKDLPASSATKKPSVVKKDSSKPSTTRKSLVVKKDTSASNVTKKQAIVPNYEFDSDEEYANEPLTFSEKMQISHDLNQLSLPRMDFILKIISKRDADLLDHETSEYEIDFELLKVKTLREIEVFVYACKHGVSRKPKVVQKPDDQMANRLAIEKRLEDLVENQSTTKEATPPLAVVPTTSTNLALNPTTSSSATVLTSNRKRKAHTTSTQIAVIVEGEPDHRYALQLLKHIQSRMSPRLVSQFRFPFIHDVTNYDINMKIGQGTFGEVFKAKCKKTHQFVALKKILMDNEREGFPITAIREIKMLQQICYRHVTELIEVCNAKSTKTQDLSAFYLVFTFCDFDLVGLLSHQNVYLRLDDIKCMMKHLLKGLYKIHSKGILHRDMKTANILVSNDGILKLADFGLSRQTIKSEKPINYTNVVVTLWYRPPELLLGSRRYGPEIDMWGVGCIMAELWTKTPILQGGTEQKQLELIQNICGGINKNVWPEVDQLPYFNRLQLNPESPRILQQKMSTKTRDPYALKLLDKLLTLDPSQRIDADKALDDDFFYTNPLPRDNIKHIVNNLPKNIFEFTARRGAHQNRARQQEAQHSQGRPMLQTKF